MILQWDYAGIIWKTMEGTECSNQKIKLFHMLIMIEIMCDSSSQ